MLYDCGVELTADGHYGRPDYIAHATRGTYTLHSLYFLLWANFGAFCISLLTQTEVSVEFEFIFKHLKHGIILFFFITVTEQVTWCYNIRLASNQALLCLPVEDHVVTHEKQSWSIRRREIIPCHSLPHEYVSGWCVNKLLY